MIRIRFFTGALSAAAVVGALAFGTAQTFAAPAPAQAEARYCDEETCAQFCGGFGFCEGGRLCICL